MPTILVIEDGTGVVGANSYATAAEVRAYATARGLTVPAVGAPGDLTIETALVKACDLLERYDYKGNKTTASNELQWPRSDVFVFDATTALADDEIPGLLKKVQCQLAVEAAAGTDLQPTGTGREVVKEKVDVIEVTYAEMKSGSITPQFNKAEEMLEPLLDNGGIALVSVRV